MSLQEVSQEFLPKMENFSLAFQFILNPKANLSSRGQKDMKYLIIRLQIIVVYIYNTIVIIVSFFL